MKYRIDPILYRGHRFPPNIISYGVWLHHRFKVSFRDIEEMLLHRGIIVTYETIRQWCLKFGKIYANLTRRKQPKRGDKWHLDEVCLKMSGCKY